MRRFLRRCAAHLIYVRRPIVAFLPLFGLTLAVMTLGSFCFHALYDLRELSWAESTFAVWSLIFSEQAYDYPHHWGVRIFYWILPPLGLVVILDGIIRFSYHILRRDDLGREWNRAMATTMRKHVVLCGLGKLGLRVLEQLLIGAVEFGVIIKLGIRDVRASQSS